MKTDSINGILKSKTPQQIVSWALDTAQNPVLTTNFRPYEAAIIHLCLSIKPDIPVIWCDTGYNTPQTYRHVEHLKKILKPNLFIYTPLQTAAYRNVIMGIPQTGTTLHDEFTLQVKLEPFKRAMQIHKPDLWFTNLRLGQTDLRNGLDVVSQSKDGITKVSPFYHWSDMRLDKYLERFELPNEFKYYDPTKAIANRECGLHTLI